MSGQVGVAPGTTTVRLPDGRVIALADWRDQPFYGTIELHIGDNSPINAFATGLSQNIPGGTRLATEVDTNLPRNGDSGLPQDFEFLCYGWGIKFVRATRPDEGHNDIDSLLTYSDPVTARTYFEVDRRTFFKYRYNRKDFTEGVIQDYPQGHGVYMATTASDVDWAENGFPSPRDRVALVIPVHHRENLSFFGVFNPIVAESFIAGAVGGQPAADGGVDLDFLDLKLYAYGLQKVTVV